MATPETLVTSMSQCVLPSSTVENRKDEEKVIAANGTAESSTSSFPLDGGVKAWSTVAGGYFNAFGVYEDYFVRNFLSDFSSSQISWIGSIASTLTLVIGLMSGRIFDRGHLRVLILLPLLRVRVFIYQFHASYALYTIGSILICIAIFTLSVAHQQTYYQVFLSLGIAFGLGSGMVYVPGIAVVMQHFSQKRAFVTGIVYSGSSLGAIVYPIMLNKLFNGPVGFANGVRASGGLVAALLLLAGLLMRTHGHYRDVQSRRTIFESAKKFMKDDVYVLAVIASFFFIQSYFFPVFYIQLLLNEKDLDPAFGFYSLTLLNIGSFFGCLIGGAVVNQFGVLNSVIGACFICGVLNVCMIGLINLAGITIFCLLYGFVSGAHSSMLGTMLASMCTDMPELGERTGLGYAIVGVGGMIGPPISGALLTSEFIWWRPILYATVCAFFSTFLLLVSRARMVERKGSSKV